MAKLCYKDLITIVKVTANEYGNKKTTQEQHDVKGTFLQNTGFLHSANQDVIDSDAILYVDPANSFVKTNANRLEGMYVVVPLFGGDPDQSWYKITKVAVNRDHLLGNKIDNIQCLLKKSEALPGVS